MKYGAKEINTVLSRQGYLKSSHSEIVAGSPLYYSLGSAVVIAPVQDSKKLKDRFKVAMETILPAITAAKDDEALKNAKTIIMPIATIFRKHWLTAHYDTQTKVATILDSRPWYMSWMWSTTKLQNGMMAGLRAMGKLGPNEPITFNRVYQGVQHNDDYCGAWAAVNSLKLATGTPIAEMTNAFSGNDEGPIVRSFEQWTKKPYQPGVFTRLLQGALNYLGWSKPADYCLDDLTRAGLTVAQKGVAVAAKPIDIVNANTSAHHITRMLGASSQGSAEATREVIDVQDKVQDKVQDEDEDNMFKMDL